jgi:hypothetical protein
MRVKTLVLMEVLQSPPPPVEKLQVLAVKGVERAPPELSVAGVRRARIRALQCRK